MKSRISKQWILKSTLSLEGLCSKKRTEEVHRAIRSVANAGTVYLIILNFSTEILSTGHCEDSNLDTMYVF